jgi:hypothetical protein
MKQIIIMDSTGRAYHAFKEPKIGDILELRGVLHKATALVRGTHDGNDETVTVMTRAL